MSPTIDLPDELCRKVTAKSALVGKPVRQVAACALTRRLQDGGAARGLGEGLVSGAMVSELPLDARLCASAMGGATRALLRAGDAFYAATANVVGARAGALTPDAWLTSQPRAPAAGGGVTDHRDG